MERQSHKLTLPLIESVIYNERFVSCSYLFDSFQGQGEFAFLHSYVEKFFVPVLQIEMRSDVGLTFLSSAVSIYNII